MSDAPLPSATYTARDALDHAWDWFKIHADQRLTMIRFFVLVAGAIGAGVGYLNKDSEFLLCGLLSLFGCVAAYCFLRLDRRTSDLIKVGENALRSLEESMAQEVNSPSMRLCLLAEQDRGHYPYSYRQNFQFLFGCVMLIFFIVSVHSFFRI